MSTCLTVVDTRRAAEPFVTVKLGDVGTSKFALDRTESIFTNFSEEFFRSIPKILAASTGWLRASVPTLEIESHSFTYFNHSLLKNGKVDKYLKEVNPKELKVEGKNLGSGMIFNHFQADKNWQTQLVLDRSAVISDGLFVSLAINTKTDIIDYDKLMIEARVYLASLLQELALELPELSL